LWFFCSVILALIFLLLFMLTKRVLHDVYFLPFPHKIYGFKNLFKLIDWVASPYAWTVGYIACNICFLLIKKILFVGRMLLCVRERAISDSNNHSSLQRQFSHGHGQKFEDGGSGTGTRVSHFLPTSRRIVQFSNGKVCTMGVLCLSVRVFVLNPWILRLNLMGFLSPSSGWHDFILFALILIKKMISSCLL
jgi:hypothetical protein